MIASVSRLKEELGLMGAASLVTLLATAAFWVACIKPMEERLQQLDRRLTDAAERPPADGLKRISSNRQDTVEAFYAHFQRKERLEDWLANLYGIATASGLELSSGDYRLTESRQRLDRYQINLPVSGSYPQVRAFLERALADIPVLSLDHASFRRKSVSDARIEVDVTLTLHLPAK